MHLVNNGRNEFNKQKICSKQKKLNIQICITKYNTQENVLESQLEK